MPNGDSFMAGIYIFFAFAFTHTLSIQTNGKNDFGNNKREK
jgi:hypothetical protein